MSQFKFLLIIPFYSELIIIFLPGFESGTTPIARIRTNHWAKTTDSYFIHFSTGHDFQAEAEKAMSEAKEFVRKMNIVSTKDKDDRNDDANSENNKKVTCMFLTFFIFSKLWWSEYRAPK